MSDIVERLRAGICYQGECRVKEAASGCECAEAADRIRELEGQHKGLVLQNALLRQRPDLPVDRIPAAQEVDVMRARIEQLEDALHWISLQHYTDQRTVTPEIAHQAYRPLIAHVNAICDKAHAALGEERT